MGFDEAASALEAAADLTTSEPDARQDEPADTQRRHEQHPATAAQLAEEQRQREGEAMLAALRASIPGIYDR